LNSTSPVSLYFNTRRHLGWADIVALFNFPASLGTFPLCTKPVVWFCYDIPEEYSRNWKKPFEALNRYLMRIQNRYIVVISNLQADRFRKIYRRDPDYLIPLAVDWRYFSEGPSKSLDGTFRVLHVGAIGKFKNQLDSIPVFKEFVKEVPNSTLTFVGPKILAGSGPQYYQELKNSIEANGLQDKVSIVEKYTREDLRNYFHTADVLLHPVSESTGSLTLFEALSASLPIVTSRKFAWKPLIEKYCIMTNSYLSGLLRVHRHPGLFRRLAKRGSKYVRDNLDIKIYAEKISEVFNTVVKYDKTYKNWWMRETWVDPILKETK
jgi:glycosyltransferase involved in cell wall biosynthesis